MRIGRALRTLTTSVDVAVFLWRRYHSAAQASAPAADAPHGEPLDRKQVVASATAPEELSAEITQTVRFGLDGQNYAIELSDESAAELREALGRYIAAGRAVGRKTRTASTAPGRPRTRQPAATNGQEAPAIRTWARANGHRISDRGPIPATVRQAYDTRQQGRDGHPPDR